MNEFSKSKELWDYEDYLVDVLGVWDCYEQHWCEDAPFVLRFEERDIWVTKRAGGTELAGRMRLDVASGRLIARDELPALFPEEGDDAKSRDTCLCWRAVPNLALFKGEAMTLREAVAAVIAGTPFDLFVEREE